MNKYQIVVFQDVIDDLMSRPDLAPKVEVIKEYTSPGIVNLADKMFLVEVQINSPMDVLDIYYAGRKRAEKQKL